ncbi:MAG: endonuclease [Gammaproteobacteria bacterium]|nr:endonuclease [Gammaproteobacteria bacterium]
MPNITDDPPVDVQNRLAALRDALDSQIPAKSDNNLLISTWNIRSFSSLTRKWLADANDTPKRDLQGLRSIIEILRRFDVIAIQEVKGNLRALRDTIRFLGDDWGFLMTDVNIGDAGNYERFLFLFDRNRVKPSGLAAEIVIPPEDLENAGPDELRRQFVRPPYAVSFLRKDMTFVLVTLHVLFGDNEAQRLPELQGIANWMRNWARRTNRFGQNLLALGDFNIDRQGSAGFQAFTSSGLTVPNQLLNLPRTIFDDPDDLDDDKFYDQIAWFNTGRGGLTNMTPVSGGNFDFMPFVYNQVGLSRTSISFRVSDHLPLWMEFEI